MIDEGQIELFPDIEIIEPPTVPVFIPHTTCSNCEHITAVQFSNGNLFFCSVQKGGKYGRKIKKTSENCKLFMQSETELKAWDGYYGGYYDKPLKR